MKLLTWNCAGAFSKKTGQLAEFNPDLAVIEECERPEKLISFLKISIYVVKK
jgi:exodeoxyribonuclease-3